MSARDDGGPAFPGEVPTGAVYYDNERCTNVHVTQPRPGMTMRDYFAAKAMQPLLALLTEFPDEHWRDGVAKDAYMMADAMLKARQS